MKKGWFHVGEALLVAVSVILTFVVSEAAYRVYLGFKLGALAENRSGASDVLAVNATYMITDPVPGHRFRQGTADYRTVYIKDNRFDRCEQFTFRADRPEISGISSTTTTPRPT